MFDSNRGCFVVEALASLSTQQLVNEARILKSILKDDIRIQQAPSYALASGAKSVQNSEMASIEFGLDVDSPKFIEALPANLGVQSMRLENTPSIDAKKPSSLPRTSEEPEIETNLDFKNRLQQQFQQLRKNNDLSSHSQPSNFAQLVRFNGDEAGNGLISSEEEKSIANLAVLALQVDSLTKILGSLEDAEKNIEQIRDRLYPPTQLANTVGRHIRHSQFGSSCR
jgi:hypothetical protein